MDRGYANFQHRLRRRWRSRRRRTTSSSPSTSTRARSTRSREVKLAGTFVVPEEELQRLLLVAPGQTFNRKLHHHHPGADAEPPGRATAMRSPRSTRCRRRTTTTHEVSLTFFVDPGNRVYVRNITFSGANRINDEVLRREMRQLEGGWLSNTSLERSKQRIQRLPYVKKVDFETTPVAGAPGPRRRELQDRGGPERRSSAAASATPRSTEFMLNGSYADANFLGTGERIAVESERRRLTARSTASRTPIRTPPSTTCSAPSRSPTAT